MVITTGKSRWYAQRAWVDNGRCSTVDRGSVQRVTKAFGSRLHNIEMISAARRD